MSQKIHIGKNGPAYCRATQRRCRYGGADTHYDSLEEAQAAVEERERERQGGSSFGGGSVEENGVEGDGAGDAVDGEGTGDGVDEVEPEEPQARRGEEVEYSFLKKFRKQEQQFNVDFDGVPKRFFSTNLRDKFLPEFIDTDDLVKRTEQHAAGELEPGAIPPPPRRARAFSYKMMQAISSPADNKMSDEDAEEMLSRVPGVKSVRPVESDLLKNTMGKGTQRGWILEMEQEKKSTGEMVPSYVLVGDKQQSAEKTYYLKRKVDDIAAFRQVSQMDLRSVAGAERIQRRNGEEHLVKVFGEERVGGSQPESRVASARTLRTLEDAQLEGQNFLANRKYVKEHSGKVATAFDDKKNPSKTHEALMDSTALAMKNGGGFRKVEVDNDVAVEEYEDFERAYNEVKDKLPASVFGKEPELRIRKLGKHGSASSQVNGLFNPARNSVVVDVRTSEAFIHEMGHHFDLVMKDNASLSDDFKSITRDYMSALDEPDENRKKYLGTPTEIFARLTERFFHEEKGVDNRLVNPSKFGRNDYAPFDDHPGLKERGFALLEKLLFEEEKKAEAAQ